ncbi:MAG: hypothetical protein KGH54_00355 [Candidatus Micrarchaeota archaeon]|nr:hypothetical protein [Candidatus Micrarchaeota archaeon]
MDALPFGQYGFGIAVGIIAIMLSISGICLGLGYALDEKRLKEFGKGEIYQSIVSGALVGFMIALFAGNGLITGVVNSITFGSASSFSCPSYMNDNAALCFSYSYLMGLAPYSIAGNQYSSLFVTVSGLLVSLLALSTILGTIAAFKINLLIVSISFSSILSPIIGEIQYVLNIVTTLALGITVQAALLSFVSVTAITVILPAGLILRSLYATRKIGGFLIALAIGTYVVLPMSYLLNATMVNTYSSVNSTDIIQITGAASTISGQINSAASLSGNQISSGIFTSLASGVTQITTQLNQLLSDLLFGISKLIMQIFILPAFSLIVTGISIKELSALLGSEASFGKFRIV